MTQKSNQTMSSSAVGEQEISVDAASTFAIKTLDVDASGKANIEATTTITKMDIQSGFGAPPNKPTAPVVLKGTLDNLGRLLLEFSAKGLNPMTMSASSQLSPSVGMLVELPDKAVQQGDSWDILVPKSPMMGATDQHLTAKWTDTKTVDGKTILVVTISGPIKVDADLSSYLDSLQQAGNAPPFPFKHLTLKGSMEFKGTAEVDEATGKTLDMDSSFDSDINTEISDVGISMDVKGKTTMQSKLKAS
jgi:hypothetical protein